MPVGTLKPHSGRCIIQLSNGATYANKLDELIATLRR